jgi:hypothetical protein
MPPALMPSATRNPVIPVKTPKAKSTFTLHNPRRLAVTVLEPEKLFTKGQRCDYVFQIQAHPLELYVELKGSDLPKALKQLASTLQLMASSLQPKLCVVVLWQGAPPKANTQRQIQKVAFERQHKCKLEWQTQHGSWRV